jgi:hypothetical protein
MRLAPGVISAIEVLPYHLPSRAFPFLYVSYSGNLVYLLFFSMACVKNKVPPLPPQFYTFILFSIFDFVLNIYVVW